MTKQEVVQCILAGRSNGAAAEASRFAPANIALCKYWGKRDEMLNLPRTSSLSVSLESLGTHTRITPAGSDEILLNGDPVDSSTSFAGRIVEFLDLFRVNGQPAFHVETRNSVPTAAGLASSASGFAALVLALDGAFGWNLPPREASILARLGSGSACRSVFCGFAEWHAGTASNGLDSFAERLDADWPALRLGILTVSSEQKALGSRAAMRQTVETSPLYASWPETVAGDLPRLRAAIAQRDLEEMGSVAEANALAMHATMMGARPAILYWQPDSVTMMERVWAARADSTPVYFTMDAGPNLKLLFEEGSAASVLERFPEAKVVAPFAD